MPIIKKKYAFYKKEHFCQIKTDLTFVSDKCMTFVCQMIYLSVHMKIFHIYINILFLYSCLSDVCLSDVCLFEVCLSEVCLSNVYLSDWYWYIYISFVKKSENFTYFIRMLYTYLSNVCLTFVCLIFVWHLSVWYLSIWSLSVSVFLILKNFYFMNNPSKMPLITLKLQF